MSEARLKGLRILCRLVLGGTLFVGGLTKIGDGFRFAETLSYYRLLPAQANQVLAVLLPWWELVLGVLLFLGLWVRPCAGFSSLLFVSFFLAAASALVRGLDISCGCFGTSVILRIGIPHLLLNGVLAGLACFVVRPAAGGDPPPLMKSPVAELPAPRI